MCETDVMYKMKPLVEHAVPVELPTCMYKMRNIHSGRNGEVINDTGHVVNTEKPPDMVEIIYRQEEILRQLAQLRDQMVTLRETLRNDSKKYSPIVTEKSEKVDEKINFDSAVININTSRPPYFLEVLQKIWKDTINLRITAHLHSTVASWPENVAQCLARLEKNSPKDQNHLPTIMLRVILKDIDTQAQLCISNVTIVGEVNILRYLARVLPKLRYEETKPYEIDSILDSCFHIVEAKTKSARAKHIQSIYKKLGKSQWLCNEKDFTVADVAVYSTLKHCDEGELNVTLTKYFQNCKSSFDY